MSGLGEYRAAIWPSRGNLMLVDTDRGIASQLMDDAAQNRHRYHLACATAPKRSWPSARRPAQCPRHRRAHGCRRRGADLGRRPEQMGSAHSRSGRRVQARTTHAGALAAGASAVIVRPYDINTIAPFALNGSHQSLRDRNGLTRRPHRSGPTRVTKPVYAGPRRAVDPAGTRVARLPDRATRAASPAATTSVDCRVGSSRSTPTPLPSTSRRLRDKLVPSDPLSTRQQGLSRYHPLEPATGLGSPAIVQDVIGTTSVVALSGQLLAPRGTCRWTWKMTRRATSTAWSANRS